MGHFGRANHQVWLFLVFPACILSYMGQGALVLDDPSVSAAPSSCWYRGGRGCRWFSRRRGDGHRSQAVITGAFSLAQRPPGSATSRGCASVHVGGRIGQIYVPWINWILLVSVSPSSSRSDFGRAPYAYGMAVTGTITITTLLFLYVARSQWQHHCGSSCPAAAPCSPSSCSSSPPT
jgi:KUP system potassium uptake protein